MKLAQRLNLFVVLAVIAAITLSAGLARYVVLASFSEQEQLITAANVERVRAALNSEQRRLKGLVADWANWDDAYTFMADRNEGFIRSNLVPEVFEEADIGLDAMLFLDNDGAVWQVAGVSWVTSPESSFVADLTGMMRRLHSDVRGVLDLEPEATRKRNREREPHSDYVDSWGSGQTEIVPGDWFPAVHPIPDALTREDIEAYDGWPDMNDPTRIAHVRETARRRPSRAAPR